MLPVSVLLMPLSAKQQPQTRLLDERYFCAQKQEKIADEPVKKTVIAGSTRNPLQPTMEEKN